jgi:hypothetical protein
MRRVRSSGLQEAKCRTVRQKLQMRLLESLAIHASHLDGIDALRLPSTAEKMRVCFSRIGMNGTLATDSLVLMKRCQNTFMHICVAAVPARFRTGLGMGLSQ